MLYRYLGQSGLLVSRICLGTMTFGMKDWGCDQKTANAIVRHFIDQGGQFIDTADMYSAGLSEEMLGNALKNHRPKVPGYHSERILMSLDTSVIKHLM